MTSIKPIYEFLLWDNCNNNCKFCFQKKNYHKLIDDQKRKSIQKVIEFLNSDKFQDGSHVMLVGGEIFDSPTIFADFNHLISIIVNMMIDKKIDLLYINTNLIYKKLDSVLFLLDTIRSNKLFDRLKFTTSYDVEGRFTEKTKQLMLHNLELIKKLYPECNIVVNSMLANKLCDMILNGEFSVKAFCNKFKVKINLIPYIILDDQLTADRNKIFKTLWYVDSEIPGYVKSYINNFDLPQDKILHRYNPLTNSYDYCSSDNSSCGHSVNFKNYSHHHTCFVCDLKELFDQYV